MADMSDLLVEGAERDGAAAREAREALVGMDDVGGPLDDDAERGPFRPRSRELAFLDKEEGTESLVRMMLGCGGGVADLPRKADGE